MCLVELVPFVTTLKQSLLMTLLPYTTREHNLLLCIQYTLFMKQNHWLNVCDVNPIKKVFLYFSLNMQYTYYRVAVNYTAQLHNEPDPTDRQTDRCITDAEQG